MSVHAKAPLRIDFAGGWTDVATYCDVHGGAVLNAAISLQVYADFLLGGRRIRLHAEDLGEHVSIASSGLICYDGKLDLHKAALNMLPVTGGIEILTRSDAPGGSGLGASGAIDVTLLAGLARCRRDAYSPEELAEFGYQLETQELKLLGGRQDQYAAALGGFHEFGFTRDTVTIRAIDVSPEAASDLARHTLLVYTGHSHFSSQTHARVWDAFLGGDSQVSDALHTIRDLVVPAAGAVAAGEWEKLAGFVAENWRQQQRLDATISTARSRAIESAAMGNGAWGLKAAGAGAGGCLVILLPPAKRAGVAEAVVRAGGEVLEADYSSTGVVVWEEEDVAPHS